VREVFCKACRKDPAEKGLPYNGIYQWNKNISDILDCLPSQAKDFPRTTGVNTVDDKVNNVVMRPRSREYHVQEYVNKEEATKAHRDNRVIAILFL
jgi:hypothetical protein